MDAFIFQDYTSLSLSCASLTFLWFENVASLCRNLTAFDGTTLGVHGVTGDVPSLFLFRDRSQVKPADRAPLIRDPLSSEITITLSQRGDPSEEGEWDE